MPQSSPRPFSWFVLAVGAAVAGIVGLTASAGLVDAMPLAWIVGVAAAAFTVRRLSRPDARAVIDAAPRGYRLAFGAGAVPAARPVRAADGVHHRPDRRRLALRALDADAIPACLLHRLLDGVRRGRARGRDLRREPLVGPAAHADRSPGSPADGPASIDPYEISAVLPARARAAAAGHRRLLGVPAALVRADARHRRRRRRPRGPATGPSLGDERALADSVPAHRTDDDCDVAHR